MFRYASFGALFLLALLANLTSYAQQQYPTYVYHICPNTTTYSKNSIYSSNLRNLFSYLSSNPFYSTGFYSTARGQSPDMAFGLFLCRGDFSPEVCRDCVVFAANDTLYRCPKQKQGVIWYDECMLRYDDENFLDSSLQNGTTGVILYNSQDVTSNLRGRFTNLVLSTLNQSATAAARSGRRFDMRKANLTAFQSLYVLAQCTPDQKEHDCFQCLRQIIVKLPLDKRGGRVVMPSCSSRFELYPFINETAIRTPPPQLDSASPPPPPPPLPTSVPSPQPGMNTHYIKEL